MYLALLIIWSVLETMSLHHRLVSLRGSRKNRFTDQERLITTIRPKPSGTQMQVLHVLDCANTNDKASQMMWEVMK